MEATNNIKQDAIIETHVLSFIIDNYDDVYKLRNTLINSGFYSGYELIGFLGDIKEFIDRGYKPQFLFNGMKNRILSRYAGLFQKVLETNSINLSNFIMSIVKDESYIEFINYINDNFDKVEDIKALLNKFKENNITTIVLMEDLSKVDCSLEYDNVNKTTFNYTNAYSMVESYEGIHYRATGDSDFIIPVTYIEDNKENAVFNDFRIMVSSLLFDPSYIDFSLGSCASTIARIYENKRAFERRNTSKWLTLAFDKYKDGYNELVKIIDSRLKYKDSSKEKNFIEAVKNGEDTLNNIYEALDQVRPYYINEYNPEIYGDGVRENLGMIDRSL